MQIQRYMSPRACSDPLVLAHPGPSISGFHENWSELFLWPRGRTLPQTPSPSTTICTHPNTRMRKIQQTLQTAFGRLLSDQKWLRKDRKMATVYDDSRKLLPQGLSELEIGELAVCMYSQNLLISSVKTLI